jgi:GDP/UDP-N,N'-diacetylbacillosamine 2-epimerase (hydrolysing)
MSVRRISYLTGTRADYGLMEATLRAIDRDPRLSLSLLVTGMHLSGAHGQTVHEIEAAGLRIAARLPVDTALSSGATMARNIGHMLLGLVDALQAEAPELLVLLGDRGEMLAGAIAALHLGIPIVHLHGGERSGTVDEPVRHAISKLSHWHFVATDASRDRLVRMGERPETIHVVGAPGLVGLRELATADRQALCASAGFDPARPIGLLVFHPVLQEAGSAGTQTRLLIDAALTAGLQLFALMPNSDAGSDDVRAALEGARDAGRLKLRTHLHRSEYVSWLAQADLLLGNSSSGIIEAASFGTPVVNVGTRQNMRERNRNVIDVALEGDAIRSAVQQALRHGRFAPDNVYGDGRTADRVLELLATLALDRPSLEKNNAY